MLCSNMIIREKSCMGSSEASFYCAEQSSWSGFIMILFFMAVFLKTKFHRISSCSALFLCFITDVCILDRFILLNCGRTRSFFFFNLELSLFYFLLQMGGSTYLMQSLNFPPHIHVNKSEFAYFVVLKIETLYLLFDPVCV